MGEIMGQTIQQRQAKVWDKMHQIEYAKPIKIAKRITGGWTEYQLNKSNMFCDDCGSQLWVAPDGKSKYCDKESDQHNV